MHDNIGHAFAVAGVAMTGGLGTGLVGGFADNALGSAGAKLTASTKDLPMDLASRMARAEEMGFRTQEPVYHATAHDFDAFDLALGGSTTGSRAAREGVSVSPDADLANEFAAIASGATLDGSRVLPLLHKTRRQARLALDGTEKDLEVAATLSDAWAQGFDSVRLLNYATPSGATGKEVVVVRNPNQLRSVSARFDPAKSDSVNLLAANAPTGAAIPLGMSAGEDTDIEPALMHYLRAMGLD